MSKRKLQAEDSMWMGGAFYGILAILGTIFIFIAEKDARPILRPVLIGLTSLFALIGIMLLAIYLPNRNKRRRRHLERIKAIEEGEDFEDIPELTEDVLNSPTIQERSSRRVVKKKKKLVLNYRKKKLIFKGEIKGKNCPICKLELRENQDILGCPQCKTPFHEDHLIQWMESENSCPVCGEAYAIINREKVIRTKKE